MQKCDIPTNIIKKNYDIFSEFLFENFNNNLTSLFPEQLKYADVKPIFKKDSLNDKKRNYRPVSILSNISKIYERLLYKELETYFESILSRYQCGFRNEFSVLTTLLPMIEKWRESIGSGGNFGALLTDLSKAFDCLPHDLLIAKLHAYGLDMPSLKLLHSYLTKRRQRVKINKTYSSWSEVLFGVPQESIIGPLLFNISLCDLFLFVPDIGIANYADDNTPHATNKHLESVLKDLEQGSDTLLKWFTDNLKANPEKYHFLVSTNEKNLNVGKVEIRNSKCEKFLGIKIDSKLMFDSHVKSLCKKASQKLNALSRVAYQLVFNQRKLLMNAFITSQFSYAPVVWMIYSRKQNHHINRIYERALRVVCKDYNSSFDELLEKDNSYKIHDRNLQKLVTEIFKVKRNLGREIMKEVFEIVEGPHALRN